MSDSKPREWWVGISDTTRAHISDVQMTAADYHMIEYSAYNHAIYELDKARADRIRAEKERDEYKSKGEVLCCQLGTKMMELTAMTKERDEWKESAQTHSSANLNEMARSARLFDADKTLLTSPHSEEYCRGANAGFCSQAETAIEALAEYAKDTPAEPKPVRKEITHEEYIDALKNSKARWP